MLKLTNVVIYFSSRDGQTLKIADRLMEKLCSLNIEARTQSIDLLGEVWLPGDDELAVICAPVRYGRHLPVARSFVRQYRDKLQEQRSAMVSINLSARKENRASPETNPYLIRFLGDMSWHPKWQAVFAGALEYELYPWYDRLVIRLIMRLTGGPLEAGKRYEFTDWLAVDQFASELATSITLKQS